MGFIVRSSGWLSGHSHFQRLTQARHDDPSSTFQEVLNVNPGSTRARMWHAAALAKAGPVDLAEWEVAELLVANPGLTLKGLELAFPFKDPRVVEQLLDALRRTGVPNG